MILFSAGFLAWGAWYRKRTLRELAEWDELQKGLEEP
jgi:hypothetical protein